MGESSPLRIAAFVAMAGIVFLVGWEALKSEQAGERGKLAGGSGARGAGAASSDSPGRSGGAVDGLEIEAGGSLIVVDVSGAVRRPGVYRFEHGLRVIDAIRRAGGATREAFASAINRAAPLTDGQQVVVPSRTPGGGSPDGAGEGGGARSTAGAEAPISLGTATQAQLEQIEGIGPVTAQSIIEFRDSRGGVSSVDELDEVRGIGPVTLEALRSRLQP